MDFAAVMLELSLLGNDRTKKTYQNNGAREPLFGTPTGAMRPLSKKTGVNQPLAEQLYASGNYDAMYFAGMIADPAAMTESDFDRWMDAAYFFMLSDFVVSVTLAESPFAQAVADKWIQSGDELRMSAGWSCYEWLLGSRKDSEFEREKLCAMLHTVTSTIHTQPNRTRYSMNGFVIAVGVSYLPLHSEALKAAESIDRVECSTPKGACAVPIALDAIQKATEKGRLGFKRKNVRC